MAWLGRRLQPGAPTGLSLTAAVAVAALLAWTFGGLAQDVVAGDGVARLDGPVHTFAVTHRTVWLTAIMTNLTWLGSNWLLLAAATALLLRRGARRAAVAVWVAYLGAIVLYTLAKPLVHRSRPPAVDLIGHATGPAFPSGHAVQAMTAWGLLAVVLVTGRTVRTRAAAIGVAGVVVLLVGVSRIYVGAHWFTDVLAGYALAGAWLSLLASI